MNFTIKKHEELSKKLTLNLKATSSNSIVEAFKNLKLKIKNNTLEVTSYNSESCVISTIDILNENSDEYEFLVEANIFKSIIDKFIEFSVPEIYIFVDLEKEKMNIRFDRIQYNLKIVKDTKDFANAPNLESYNNYKTAVFKTNVLRRAFLNTKKCTKKDQARPILEAVNIVINDNKADIFAIDGYKLAFNELECDCSESFKTSLSNSSAISILTDVLNDGFDFVELNSNGVYTMVENDNLVVFFREICGETINYHKFISRIPESLRITVNKKSLLSAITGTNIGNSSNAPVRLRVNPSDNTITFSVAKTHEYNGAVNNCEIPIEVEIENKPEDILDIYFNSIFFIELLSSIYTDNCNLIIQSSMQPFFLENEHDNKSTYLLLPVRVSQ